MPDSKNKIDGNLTWEQVNKYIVQAMGALMILGGALVLINLRKAGGVAIMVVLVFMMITQDNPILTDHIKPKPKNNHVRLNDVTRHLSLMGTCLFMMVCPAYEHDDDDEEAASTKGKKKQKSE